MKIVVVGGGKVGEVICQELSTEENDIVLIDKNQDLIDRLLNKFDIMDYGDLRKWCQLRHSCGSRSGEL